MARIYISSTYSDLRDHREAVYRALRQLGHDVVAMEDYVAADQRPLDRCLADVASSDLYVGIIAWRYGYVPPQQDNPAGFSITMLEYLHARQRGIPCLVFLLRDDVPWPRQMFDDDLGRIEGLRNRLTSEQVVSMFGSAEDLARLVVIAVSNKLTTAGTEAPSTTGQEGDGVRLLVAYARRDGRLVNEVTRQLAVLQREGLVAALADFQVDDLVSPGFDPYTAIRDADVALLMLSVEFVTSGFFDRSMFEWLVERHESTQLKLLPVLLRPMARQSIVPSLSRIPLVPRQGQAVTESPSREAAIADVVESTRFACLEVLTSRRVRAPRQPRPVRVHHRLVEVFKESGVPSVTFVEPDDFFVLKLALEQPGRGVVIEGPSGVGKTTALETAINELEGAGASERFTKLRARDPEHVARIAELRSWHRGPVSIDDFHRLDATVRSDLVDYLKLLADTEMEDRKLVIVGIPGTRQQLVQFAFDVATRIDVLTLGAVSDDKVKEMIEKGEAALNIELLGKSEIVRTAAGSLLIAQKLCQHSAALAGIRETQATFTPVTSDLPRAVGTVMEQMASKFGGLVQSFAALDGPSHRLCIELLMELAVTKDGTLPLRSLRERRADLAAGIDRFIENRLMGTLAERHEDHDQHLLYEHETATLVIDDPQLTFYLRQLTPEQLAAEAGKAPLVKRMRVFVSYSHAHEDAKWLQRLRVHLAPLERDGLIDLWDDTRIAAGSLWRDEINAALDTAKAAVLLISADFLASDFIQDKELPPLLSTAAGDGCTVLPLLLSPSLFEETPELSRFQAVNRHGTPLSAMSASEGETTLVELTKRIAQLVRQHP